MSIITLLLFFAYSFGLGFTVTNFIKNSKNFLERNLMRIGIGLGVFVVLGVILNFLHILIDWKIFLALSLILPLFVLFKKIKLKELKTPKLKLKLTKSNLSILIALGIFFFCLHMYVDGAFQYPYMEDDDPWAHAMTAKYVSVSKTVNDPPNFDFHYIDPYSPGYTMLMAILHQTNDSISWTLKFFNSLIISLGILFFYFFAKSFTKNRNKALFATFILAVIPSYFTHFIWAHTFVIMLFFPTMYCLEMIKHDKKWIYPSIILIASIILTQPSNGIKLGIMLIIYWVVKSIIEKNINKEIAISGLGGILLSLVWWYTRWKPMIMPQLHNFSEVPVKTSLWTQIKTAFPYDGGSATRAYTFNDFFIAKPFGGINVHVGWGIFVSILVVIGLIYILIRYKDLLKKENVWIPITIAWFIFTFLGTNSMTFSLPLGIWPFRFWILLAIPVALICSSGLWALFGVAKKFKIPALLILIIALFGVFATSGYQKYNQNHEAIWPPGAKWTSTEELQAYLWLKTLPPDTKVFSYDVRDKFVYGMDKYLCDWCPEVIEFREKLLERNTNELHSFLKRNNYKYLIVSAKAYNSVGKKFGENKTIEKINSILKEIPNHNGFVVAHQTQGAVIFKVI